MAESETPVGESSARAAGAREPAAARGAAEPAAPALLGGFERWFGAEAQRHAPVAIARLQRVLRFDAAVFGEIESDPAGVPQAFAVVIASALLAGVGQGAPVLIFLGVAWALLAWLLSAALIWGVGTLVLARDVPYSRLVVGLGYGYVWVALLFLARLPGVGALVGLAALGLCFASFVQASARALEIPRERAVGICAGALALPFALLLATLV